ncbi:MAG: glycosyltransferase family 4 protein [Actinomycetota bacterium]
MTTDPTIDTATSEPATARSVPAAADGSRPRVLLAHRFYYPDVTTYSQMLRIIGEHLDRDGFDVTVFSTQPGYNGVYDGPPLPKRATEAGLTVHRAGIPGAGSSLGRLLGGFVYGLLLIAHCVRRRGTYDAISVSTVPPVLMGLCGTIAARLSGAKLVYHCMDLYPEIAVASGLSTEGFLTSVARRLDMITVRSATTVIVLSDDMAATLAARGHHNRNVEILNNFTIEEVGQAAPLPDEFARGDKDRFRVLFAGNLGRFQGLDTVMTGFLAAREADESLELCFMGAGAMESELRSMAGDEVGRSVQFWPHSPLPIAMDAIADADLALVSLVPGLVQSAFPSKTLMYLEMGTRIMAVVEADSALARLVEDEKVGTVAPVGDHEALAAELVAEAAQATARRQDGDLGDADRNRATEAAARLFGQPVVLPKWTTLYADLLGVSHPAGKTAADTAARPPINAPEVVEQ